MLRWIFAAALLLSAAPSVFADGHRHGRGHGHAHGHGHYRAYYAPPPRAYFGAGFYYGPRAAYVPAYRPWAPGYAVVPAYYRPRFVPVPAEYYANYGPVPYGCRRAYLDGYVVDYRPSTYLVVNFARAW